MLVCLLLNQTLRRAVQFVQMNQFQGGQAGGEALAKELLAEIPGQLMSFMSQVWGHRWAFLSLHIAPITDIKNSTHSSVSLHTLHAFRTEPDRT